MRHPPPSLSFSLFLAFLKDNFSKIYILSKNKFLKKNLHSSPTVASLPKPATLPPPRGPKSCNPTPPKPFWKVNPLPRKVVTTPAMKSSFFGEGVHGPLGAFLPSGPLNNREVWIIVPAFYHYPQVFKYTHVKPFTELKTKWIEISLLYLLS